MNDIVELTIFVIIGVTGFTIVYRILPFKEWKNKKPKFTFFPKYIASFDKPVSEIESALEKIQFKKNNKNIYSRGKVYGDFSAKAIKLSVEVSEDKKQVKLYASFFGVLFDTGDVWQVMADIINGQNL